MSEGGIEIDGDRDGHAAAGPIDDLPDDGWGRLVDLGGGRQVALFREGEDVYALDRTCPHAGGPLEEGMVIDGAVMCPLHAYSFDLVTGRCREDPSLAVDCYPVRVSNGVVLVGRRPRGGAAAPDHDERG